MTEQEFNDIVNDLMKFGKDLGIKTNFSKSFSNNGIWRDFFLPESKFSLLRFTAFEKDNKICNLKIILFPFNFKLFNIGNLNPRIIFFE